MAFYFLIYTVQLYTVSVQFIGYIYKLYSCTL